MSLALDLMEEFRAPTADRLCLTLFNRRQLGKRDFRFEETGGVFLTDDAENPNEAQVRFLVDGAQAPDVSGYQRAVYLFDGNDPDAVTAARAQWSQLKDGGHDVTYWQQSERGKWEKKA